MKNVCPCKIIEMKAEHWFPTRTANGPSARWVVDWRRIWFNTVLNQINEFIWLRCSRVFNLLFLYSYIYIIKKNERKCEIKRRRKRDNREIDKKKEREIVYLWVSAKARNFCVSEEMVSGLLAKAPLSSRGFSSWNANLDLQIRSEIKTFFTLNFKNYIF